MLLNKQIPFVTPIWTSLVEVTESMASKCVEFMSKNPSATVSNVGGYQSQLFSKEVLESQFSEILKTIAPSVKGVVDDLKTALKVESAWVNINSKGDFNMPHIHPNSSFSAVLYLKAPMGCGNLIFKNPTYMCAYPLKDNVPGFWGAWSLEPKEGLFCIFPAYLEHYVEPSKADDKRISVAFNFLQV